MSGWKTFSQLTDPVPPGSRFVARQPIVDRLRRTYGYELLFRSGWENRFNADGEAASQQVIDATVSYGLESLVGDAVPFVNCTRQLLLERLPTLLPSNTVLEVLEDSEVDAELTQACRDLRMHGYQLAIDDFDFDRKWEQILPFTDMIKVDFRASTPRQRQELIYRLRHHPIRFLAEKIETEEEFRIAMDEGFQLFQGYFFTRPVVLAHRSLTAVLNKLRFMVHLNQPTLDRNVMLRMVEEEPALSLRLLRLANSAAIAPRAPITSLRSALSLVGDEQFRKLAMLFVVTEFGGAGAVEPVRFILQRARFCELLAPHLGLDASEMYLFGMLTVLCASQFLSVTSMAGAMLLRPEILAALHGEPNIYSRVLQMTRSYEEGQWDSFASLVRALKLDEEQAGTSAVLARRWTESLVSML